MAVSDIAEMLGRNPSTMTRLLVKRLPRKPQGRPPSLKPAQIDAIVKKMDELILKAKGNYQVSAGHLQINNGRSPDVHPHHPHPLF